MGSPGGRFEKHAGRVLHPRWEIVFITLSPPGLKSRGGKIPPRTLPPKEQGGCTCLIAQTGRFVKRGFGKTERSHEKFFAYILMGSVLLQIDLQDGCSNNSAPCEGGMIIPAGLYWLTNQSAAERTSTRTSPIWKGSSFASERIKALRALRPCMAAASARTSRSRVAGFSRCWATCTN